MAQINPYIHFNGNAEEAFAFYKSVFGGDFAQETIHYLRTTGANKTADILQKTIDQFPTGNVPEDRTERQEILEQIQETADPVWEELDQMYYTRRFQHPIY